MTEPSREELERWLKAEILADKGGDSPEGQFAAVAKWGADPAEVRSEVQAVARELGIRGELAVEFADENPQTSGGRVSGGWDPVKKTVLINKHDWDAVPGWKRRDTIGHEVMHASQTLTRRDWEAEWKEMTRLAGEASAPGMKTGSEEFWRRQWNYRHHPFEAEAIAFGRAYRGRSRATST